MSNVLEITFVVLYSACFGSFLNVVIYRIPCNMSLIYPASCCPSCGCKISWYDNIPLLSFIFLRGKCRHCGEKISIRYFLVELLTVFMCLLTYLIYDITSTFILGALAMMVYICIIFIDYKYYIIPDILNFCIFGIGLISFLIDITDYLDFKVMNLFDVYSKVKGFILGFCICFFFELIIRVTKKRIIGYGDLKLIIASSLFLGVECLLMGIFIASFIATIIELPLSLNKKIRKDHVLPFGPYLSYGFMISFLFGSNLFKLYLNLIGG